MPKSRRDKPIALTKTKKHGRASKERLIADIRECVSSYGSVYVFEVDSMRNVKLKELREEWGGSRFFLGKNRVMQRALGRGEDDEPREGSSKLAPYVSGQRGLLFTDTSKEAVLNYFSSFSDAHYARSGCVASEDFTLEKGPLPVDIAPHPLEPTLRKLGLPTRLNAAVVELMQDTVVCKQGDVLTPEQCRLLQLFDQKQAAFRLHIIAALTYTADSTHGTLDIIREGATMHTDDSTLAAAAASRTGQRQRRQQRTETNKVASVQGDEDEVDDSEGETGEGEGEGDDVEEFVPEPLDGWGEIAVPSYS